MKNLIIAGAGNAAREVLQIIKDINRENYIWNIAGFIADTGMDIKSLTNGDFEIIGTIDKWQPNENECFVCAIAEPAGREFVVNKLQARGAHFINLFHPSARLNDYCNIGDGVILYPGVHLGPNSKVDNFVFLQSGIAHDCEVGEFSTITGNCSLTGGVKVGKRVFIGSGAIIAPGKKIGDDAFVSLGSVVIRDVKAGNKVFGNPARRVD